MSDGWTQIEAERARCVVPDDREPRGHDADSAEIDAQPDHFDTGALFCLDGTARGESFPVNPFDTVIGRAPRCDVTVDHDSISRRHLRLQWTENGPLAVDLKSKNGVFINGQREYVCLVEHGVVVRVGAVRFRYERETP